MSDRERLDLLTAMHTYCRPADSSTEGAFIKRFIKPLPGAYGDPFNNWHVEIGESPSVLFSCHTDTVHRLPGFQHAHIRNGQLCLTRKARKHSSCLGADDTVGVFLMIEMIKAGIPGRYVFHYGEEMGCKGSVDLARAHADWLRTFKMAVAFDRRGTEDIITHQCGRRTCSNDFAWSMACLRIPSRMRLSFPNARIYQSGIQAHMVRLSRLTSHTPSSFEKHS